MVKISDVFVKILIELAEKDPAEKEARLAILKELCVIPSIQNTKI